MSGTKNIGPMTTNVYALARKQIYKKDGVYT